MKKQPKKEGGEELPLKETISNIKTYGIRMKECTEITKFGFFHDTFYLIIYINSVVFRTRALSQNQSFFCFRF